MKERLMEGDYEETMKKHIITGVVVQCFINNLGSEKAFKKEFRPLIEDLSNKMFVAYEEKNS